ncbi:MAG: hypothetical protein K8E66_10275 [Phycisphaerales bacterium]|nr:hypothetical protein [Phycisphaerales bacterium]
MGRVTLAPRRAGVLKEDRDAFVAEATSGDYDHLLQTVMRWVATDEPSEDDDYEFEED